MSKLESARRTGFNGLRSKSGEWIVIKNKKKKNWQKIENNKPMMLHQSSSSEEFEGGIEENNDEGDGYRAGEEGDDEIENEDLQGEEEEDDSVKRKPGAPHRSMMKFTSKSTSNLHTHMPRPQIAGAQPIPGPSSAPLLPFPPGFVPRPSPSFKPTQATLTPHPISNRPVPQHTSPKQTEKISTTTGFCRYFLQGYCRDGKRCVFSHDASTLKRTQSDPQEYDDPLITNDDHPSNNNSHPSPLVGRPIYRSHSSDMSSHSLTHHTHHHNNQRPNQHHHNHIHNHDHDHPSSSSPLDFQLESITVSSPLNHPLDLPHRRNNNLPPPFVSPTTSIMSETGSEVSSRSSMSNLFSSSTSPFTLLPSTPSIPVPFPSLPSTYSASNPTSPFASSLSPDILGGLSAFRLNTSYSHASNSKSLSGKAISRSLSRPSNGIDSTTSENNSPYESSRSRSLTSESTTSTPSSSFSLGWSSFPRSAPSHFYTYDTPLAGPSSSPHLGSSILAQLTSGTPGPSVSSLLSKKSSVESSPLMSSMGMPNVQSGSRMHTPHLGPVEDVPLKLEEEELDEKHADLDLKLVELALSDGPESILLDQHSNTEDPESITENNSSPIPENNTTTTIQSILVQSNHGNNNNNSDGVSGVISVEFPNVSPSVSPFDPTDLNLNLSSIGVGITLNNNNQESIINESLSVNLSSGEESPSDSPSSPHQNQQSADEQDQDQDELLDASSMLTTSKPIPIPGSSPASYSSIVRASTSPVLTSASAPMTKKSNAALKKEKDDVKAILPVAALSDKKGRKVCSFFLQGICRYGQQCRHRHLHCVSDKCLSCGLTCGSTQEEQQQHLQTCTEVVAMEKERRESGSRKCGICHQLTLKLNRKFGLLISCNHSFCLQCIREWRGSSEHSRERVRACPICKVVSHYVIPCDRHVAEPSRKQRVIVEYKWRLGQIDCKHYNRGKSVCPFGEACFYRHEDSSSPKSKAKRGPKTYSEGIFDDDDEEEEGDLEDEEEEVLQVVNNNNNNNHQRDGHNKNQSQSSATSQGGRSVPLLKFAKKQKNTTGPSMIPTTSSSMHVKTKNNHVKKNNNNINGKYVKGKSQKKK